MAIDWKIELPLGRGETSRIARISGIPKQTVSRYLANAVANPGVNTVKEIKAAITKLKAERRRKCRRRSQRLPAPTQSHPADGGHRK